MCCGRGEPALPVKSIPISFPMKPMVVLPKYMLPAPIPIVSSPPGSINPPGRFCTKCGWIVALSKTVDSISGQIVEQRGCTNMRCTNY